jgi:hypothetical protein
MSRPRARSISSPPYEAPSSAFAESPIWISLNCASPLRLSRDEGVGEAFGEALDSAPCFAGAPHAASAMRTGHVPSSGVTPGLPPER